MAEGGMRGEECGIEGEACKRDLSHKTVRGRRRCGEQKQEEWDSSL